MKGGCFFLTMKETVSNPTTITNLPCIYHCVSFAVNALLQSCVYAIITLLSYITQPTLYLIVYNF